MTAPTLLIQGAEDPYGSLRPARGDRGARPGPVERLVLPGGHSQHLEHERQVADAICAFLALVPADEPRVAHAPAHPQADENRRRGRE